MFDDQFIHFYKTLKPPALPKGFGILHPQQDKKVMQVVNTFFKKYYPDTSPRKLILGINPGRFGAGITGINFTAPRQLRENCHIDHPWDNSSELSAEFIYMMIEAYGGAEKFYGKYFLGSVSPLGYVKDGRNINYYDDKRLSDKVTPFIITSIKQQLEIGLSADTCYCIGGEKNYRFLSGLNERYKFFQNIVALPHPRYIMQYRRKHLKEHIEEYVELLR